MPVCTFVVSKIFWTISRTNQQAIKALYTHYYRLVAARGALCMSFRFVLMRRAFGICKWRNKLTGRWFLIGWLDYFHGWFVSPGLDTAWSRMHRYRIYVLKISCINITPKSSGFEFFFLTYLLGCFLSTPTRSTLSVTKISIQSFHYSKKHYR